MPKSIDIKNFKIKNGNINGKKTKKWAIKKPAAANKIAAKNSRNFLA
jgi:hypothetical protein